jgi:hypothetical protein
MSSSDVEVLKALLQKIESDLIEVKHLASATNGRVRELEFWRARLQGVAQTGRISWLVSGGVIGAVAIELMTRING